MKRIAALTFTALALVLSGCGNYTSTTRKAREEYYAGRYTEAAKELEKGAQEEGNDQLLYVFDRATALHSAAMYDEAIKEFQRAERIADIKDYTSLSKEAATLVTNDKILPYKGEDFEKVLVNQYMAIDFLMLNNLEAAQVENRKVNRKLYLMITEGKRKYKLNPMARYLSALIYELDGHFNDAYIDYKKVFELMPGLPYLREDLYRSALKAGLGDDAEKWKASFELDQDDVKKIRADLKKPEIVVIVENGRSPEKRPHPNWNAIPKYYPRHNPVSHIVVTSDAVELGRSHLLFSVERTAIENLDEKFAGLLAKRIGGVVVKEGIGMAVDENVSPILGAALRLGMYVADQADLRSWLTLPRDFQVFRFRAEPGKMYTLRIEPRDSAGNPVGSSAVQEKVVTVGLKPNSKVFVPIRVI